MTLDHHTHIRVLRLMASVTLAVTLVAACGSSDSKTPVAREQSSSTPTDPTDPATSADPTLPTEDSGGGSALPGGDPCAAIEAANLSEATGVDYTLQDSDETQCTYASASGSVINLTLTDVSGDSGGLAFDSAKSICEEGSISDLTVAGADDAYRCTLMGISQLGAIHDSAFVLVTGADILGEAAAGTFDDVLVAVLENGVAAS